MAFEVSFADISCCEISGLDKKSEGETKVRIGFELDTLMTCILLKHRWP